MDGETYGTAICEAEWARYDDGLEREKGYTDPAEY